MQDSSKDMRFLSLYFSGYLSMAENNNKGYESLEVFTKLQLPNEISWLKCLMEHAATVA